MKELTIEDLKALPIADLLPDPYRTFSDDLGNVNWDSLEMCYPGYTEKLLEILQEELKMIDARVNFKLRIREGNFADMTGPKGITGVKGATGPTGR